jgi:hypothetical protein
LSGADKFFFADSFLFFVPDFFRNEISRLDFLSQFFDGNLPRIFPILFRALAIEFRRATLE